MAFRITPVRLLIAILLLLAGNAEAATVVIGSERVVAPLGNALASPFANNGAGMIASDTHSFLVAWTESYTSGYGAIETASLDAGGTLRHRGALPYGVDADVVALAWTGDAYRIVWQRRADLAVVSVDVDSDGSIVRPQVVLVPGETAIRVLSVACAQERTLIIYQKLNAATYTRAATVVDTAGVVVRGELDVNDVAPNVQSITAIADDHGFSFFWSGGQTPQFTETLFMRHLTPDGVADSNAIAVAGVNVVFPIAAAFAGDHYAVALAEDVVKPGTNEVASAAVRRFVVSRSGTSVELPSTPISLDQSIQAVHFAPGGAGFLAYWRLGANDLQTVRFNDHDAGTVQDHAVSMLPSVDASLASGGTIVGVDGAVAGFLLDTTASGTPVQTFSIALYPVAQRGHGVASIGSQSLIVWSELDGSDPNGETRVLYATRVASDGSTIDHAPLLIAHAGSTDGINAPGVAVVGAGSRYWIAWTSGPVNTSATVMLRSLSTDGALGDVQTLPFHAQRVSLATDGALMLLAFGGDTTPLSAARLTATGTVLDDPALILGRSFDPPSVVWNGTDFLVAWTDPEVCTFHFCTVPYFSSRVVAARVTRTGGVLDPTPIPITGFLGYIAGLHVGGLASSAGDTLIAYSQSGATMAKRVLATGALAGSTAEQDGSLLDPSHGPTALQAAPHGYFAFTSTPSQFSTNVLGVDEAGRFLESEGTFSGVVAGVTRRDDGTLLVVYTRPADERAAAGATQVFTRLLTVGAPRLRAVR